MMKVKVVSRERIGLNAVGFYLIALYPLLIQLKKVFAIDLKYFSITPISLVLTLVYFFLLASRPIKIDFIIPLLVILALASNAVIWNVDQGILNSYLQYYVFEILVYFSILRRLQLDTLVKAILFQMILSIGFVGLEIALAGGIDLNAIASRKIGIGQGGITGLFDEPALLSFSYMLNIFIIAYGIERRVVAQRLGLFVIIVAVAIIVLTLTRATLLFFAIVFLMVLGFYFSSLFNKSLKQSWLYQQRKAFFLCSGISIFLGFLLKGYIDSRFGDTSELTYMTEILSENLGLPLPTITANLIYRIDQTQAALMLIAQNPLGIGPLNSVDAQKNFLIFSNFANYNSGNLITDFFVNFGIPISLIFFYVLFRMPSGWVAGSSAQVLIVRLGVWFLVFNVLIATNFLVAVTATVVEFMGQAPNIYLGFPVYVGPRNIDGFIFVTYLSFVFKAKSEPDQAGV
ncbi:hypothetical protein KEHDKFFH_01440 [Marinobacter maroccanus]|uniref:Uncharacterized protein n=1 Tax=Marinobacter maroccanus TaxID=2055143 RepID=A0A2S5ZFP7_9GAMM|nr:hypothetical protein [Marinobacter maroccanus]PPI86012.1 hypothetical protein KEHDKFFH_01440 [Marinobacter maroccanus]